MLQDIPEKTQLRWNKELVDLHKKCITSYLVAEDVKFSIRKKIFKLYDTYINEKNIRLYFFTPTHFLIRALVLDDLEQVQMLIKPQSIKKHVKRTRNSRKR